jgi:hypothetical protein
MSLAVPVTNGMMTAGAQVFAGSAGVGSYEQPPAGGGSVAAVQGTGSLAGLHNTPLHVAGILLVAGTIIIGAHYLGFRIGFDVGLGR